MATGKKVAVWLSIAVILGVGGYFGYKYYQKKKNQKPETKTDDKKSDTTTTSGGANTPGYVGAKPVKPPVANGGGIPEQTTPKLSDAWVGKSVWAALPLYVYTNSIGDTTVNKLDGTPISFKAGDAIGVVESIGVMKGQPAAKIKGLGFVLRGAITVKDPSKF